MKFKGNAVFRERSRSMKRNESRGQGKNMSRNMEMKGNEMAGFVLVQTEGKEQQQNIVSSLGQMASGRFELGELENSGSVLGRKIW